MYQSDVSRTNLIFTNTEIGQNITLLPYQSLKWKLFVTLTAPFLIRCVLTSESKLKSVLMSLCDHFRVKK